MDTATWLSENATPRIQQEGFTCLEGCGFCCTFPPEVSDEELADIEQETEQRSFGVDPEGRTYLPLQGGCGGCTLLEDRRCTAYEVRPMHCRLFPFHVYFGRHVEVYANRVCPGLDAEQDVEGEPVDPGALASIETALGHAMGAARADRVQQKHEDAQRVHEAFERIARQEEVWMQPERAIEDARTKTRITPQAWADALDPFRTGEEAAFPTMVLPKQGFPWRAWRLEEYTFSRYRFLEDGTLEKVGEVPCPSLDEQAPEACYHVLDRLIGYECFAGGIFDRVDHAAYDVQMADAAWGEMNEVLAELAIRAHLVDAEGLPVTPSTVSAAYEAAFYDRPAIGAWL